MIKYSAGEKMTYELTDDQCSKLEELLLKKKMGRPCLKIFVVGHLLKSSPVKLLKHYIIKKEYMHPNFLLGLLVNSSKRKT